MIWRRSFESAAKDSEFWLRQLPQRDFPGQIAGDRPSVLDSLVDHLLLFALVAILFHAQLQDFQPQSIESGHVLVGDLETNVPVVYAGFRLVQEDAIAFDEPGLLLGVPDRLDVRSE